MITVRCPQCKHDQRCDPKLSADSPTIVGKKKSCVYCGMTFSIHSNIEKTNVVAPGIIENNMHFLRP